MQARWKHTRAGHKNCELDVETGSSVQSVVCIHDLRFLLGPSDRGSCQKKNKMFIILITQRKRIYIPTERKSRILKKN